MTEGLALERNLRLYRLFTVLAITPFFLPITVIFWQDNGLDLFDVYLLQGLFAVAVVVLEVPTGMVADRLGKRTSLLMAQALALVGIIIYALSHGFWGFLAGELVLALGASLLSGADSALLYDTLKAMGREDEYTRYEGETRSIQMLAFAGCSLVGGFIGEVSLRGAVWASGIGPAVGFVLALGFREVQASKTPATIREAVDDYKSLISASLRFIRKHRLVKWLICFNAVFLGSSTWLLWLYQPYMEWSGLDLWAFGAAFGIFNLFAALCSRYASRFETALGEQRARWALMAIHLIPLPLMASFVGPLSFLFILGHQASRALLRPLITGWLLRYVWADKRATVLSLNAMSGRLFFAITAPFIGLAADAWTIPETLFFELIILSILFVALWWAYHRVPQKYFQVKDSVREQQ